jgi:hypothetical protein
VHVGLQPFYSPGRLDGAMPKHHQVFGGGVMVDAFSGILVRALGATSTFAFAAAPAVDLVRRGRGGGGG